MIPCRLVPLKYYPKREETPPLKVSQIIETKYKNKYIRKGGEMRSNSEKMRVTSVDYRKLCIEQSNIIISNTKLSKENKAKLTESLDRILRTVSPKKGKIATPPVHPLNDHLQQTSQSIKLPAV